MNKNEAIEELLNRRLETFEGKPSAYPSLEDASKKLSGNEKLRVFLGIDPTGPNLHLGHTIPLLFLKQLLKIGHKPVLLIGDFTARIGDPTGKDAMRKPLSKEEVKNNMRNYLVQVYKILPKGSFEVKYNSSWLSRMSLEDVVGLARHVSVQQMLQREMFQKRLWNWKWKCPNCGKISHSPMQFGTQEAFDTATLQGNSIQCRHCNRIVPYEKKDIFMETGLRLIGLHEFLYPLMQGYDSVAMKIDGEVGGNDQTFNMLVGRDLEKKLLNKEKMVFATRLLVDAESRKKMSKTEGGLISLSDSPDEMFGKTMKTVPDEMIVTVFELCTEKDLSWINNNKNAIKSNPLEFKKQLAFELVKMYHDEKEAKKASSEWAKVFSNKEKPTKIAEVKVKSKNIVDVLVETKLASSKSEAKRLLAQNGVRVDDQTASESSSVESGNLIQVGKRKFVKIK